MASLIIYNTLLALVALATSAVPAERTAAQRVRCRLLLVGNPQDGTVAQAQLNCTGGKVVASVNDTLLGVFKDSFLGVTWAKDGYCHSAAWLMCLLTFCGDTRVILDGPIISGIHAPLDVDGIVCITGGSEVVVTGAQVQNNRFSSLFASALIVMGEDTGRPEVNVFHSNFSSNTGTALYLVKAGDVTITGSEFRNNSSIERALDAQGLEEPPSGALHVLVGSALTIKDSQFLNNRCLGDGAAVCVQQAGALTIAGSQFLNNTSVEDGAAINADVDDLTIADSKFLNNTSGGNGGALSARVYVGNLTITGSSKFLNNTSGGNGGALSATVSVGNLTITGSQFLNNTSGRGTSPISAVVGGNLTIADSDFDNLRDATSAALHVSADIGKVDDHLYVYLGVDGDSTVQDRLVEHGVQSVMVVAVWAAGKGAARYQLSNFPLLAPILVEVIDYPTQKVATGSLLPSSGIPDVCLYLDALSMSMEDGNSHDVPTLRNLCISPRRDLIMALMYSVFGILLLVIVAFCVLLGRQRRHQSVFTASARSNTGGKGGSSNRLCCMMGRVSTWFRGGSKWATLVLALWRVGLMVFDIVTDILALRALLEFAGDSFSGNWLWLGYAICVFTPHMLSSLLLHINAIQAQHALNVCMGAEPCCYLFPFSSPCCTTGVGVTVGLVFPWMLLTLPSDIPLMLLHSLSSGRWFPWLRMEHYGNLHSFLAASIESTFSVVVMTVVYCRGASHTLPIRVSDMVFCLTVGSSLLHIMFWVQKMGVALAEGTARQLMRSMFKELVDISGASCEVKGPPCQSVVVGGPQGQEVTSLIT